TNGLAEPPAATGRGAGLAVGADGGAAGSDAARPAGRASCARHSGELQGDLELLSGGAADVQKKACTPPNRIDRTWRAGGRSGRSIKAGLMRGAWSSSMRPGPRPI